MKKEYIKRYCFIGIIVVSLIILFFGVSKNIYNTSLVGVLLIYALCITNCFKDIKNNVFLLLFYFVIFVFILSRPTISFLRGDIWYYFSSESVNWSLITIAISLLSLLCGKWIYNHYNKKRTKEQTQTTNKMLLFIYKNKDIITKIVFIIFLFVAVVYYFNEIDKLLFMRGKNYEQYYTSYASRLPKLLNYVSALFLPLFMLLLSFKPKKSYCYSSIIIFAILQIPMFIIGERGSLIKAIIFVILYLYIYLGYERIKKIFTKKKLIGALIMLFTVIVLLGSYNYIRSNEKINNYNPFLLFVDFFYKQGTSYDTINYGYEYKDRLPYNEEKNYTFGPIIDNINNNVIIHKLFNTKIISEENSVDAALNGNNLSHALTYAVKKDEYLKGHGMGSSYLIETYLDYGYVGVAVYSLLIGILLTSIPNILSKTSFVSVLGLYVIKEIYVIPRAEAISFVKFLFRASFWFAIIIVLVIIGVIYYMQKNRKIKKKSIAIVDLDITVMGGVEKVAEQLANKLSDKYDVKVISLHRKNKEIPYIFNEKIKVIFSSTDKFDRIRKSIKNNSKSFKKIIKEENVSLAICMGNYSTFISILDKGLKELKIINCDHGALINQYNDKAMVFIRHFNYLFSSHSVLLTNKNKLDYQRLLHASENKLSVIYNPISNKMLNKGKKVKYNINSDKIITVGRLSQEKGFDMLIQVATKLKKITKVNWQWDIYGDGPMKEEIQKNICENKLEKYVVLKGQHNNVTNLLHEYAIYVLTSYREGLPIVLLEAKANKLPIVSFDIDTGPNEIVDDNKNGFLIDPYDTNNMAEKIKSLLEMEELRKEFSSKSCDGIEKFNENRIIVEWIELIDKILKE